MELNKFEKLVFVIILYGLLLALPILMEIHYIAIYYTGVIMSIPLAIYRLIFDEKYEQRFHNRWHKTKEQGFWVNVIREAMKSLVLMVLVVVIGQLIGNGRTPLEIVTNLSGGVLIFLLFFLLAFNLIVGIAAWHGNNKRYSRLNYIYNNNPSRQKKVIEDVETS